MQLHHHLFSHLSPLVDNICSVTTVWRIGGKIIRTALRLKHFVLKLYAVENQNVGIYTCRPTQTHALQFL